MINSLTHRIISSESLERSRKDEAIQWANICLKEGIETESILILSTLSENDDSWQIKDYLEQSLGQIGLKFLDKQESLNCFIKSYILEILEDLNLESSLRALYQIYHDFGRLKELRNFFLLYWANESWKQNHEDKEWYIEGFKPHMLREKLIELANEWIKENKVNYFNIDDIRVITKGPR